MDQCPKCRHTLLSHASPRCSWCGEEITDATYQEQAQAEREAYFAHQKAHDAASLAQTATININGFDPQLNSATRMPISDPFSARRAERKLTQAREALLRAKLPRRAPVQATENPQTEISEQLIESRFHDLELD